MSEPAIRTLGLTKFYGRHRGIENVDLEVERGQVFGFLGPNGAGKSTTIRCLLDLLRPTAGAASVLGLDPRRDAVAVRSRVGYLPGDLSMYAEMSGRQLCRYFASLRGIDLPPRAETLAMRLNLDLDRKIGAYSTGNRQKVGLVQAFMHRPELLILDEPTSGLDPLMETVFQDTVREMLSDGKTVLLSSHILAEVESLCDRVTIIREGRTVEAGTLAELRHLTRTTVEVTTTTPVDSVANLTGVDDFVASAERHATFAVANTELGAVMRHLADLGIEAIEAQPPTLEELFMRHYAVDGATVGPTRDAVGGGTGQR